MSEQKKRGLSCIHEGTCHLSALGKDAARGTQPDTSPPEPEAV